MTNTDEMAIARSCMCASVRRTGQALANLYDDILAPSGLRAMQFSLLSQLAGVEESTLTRLAEVRGIDRTRPPFPSTRIRPPSRSRVWSSAISARLRPAYRASRIIAR